MSTSRSAPLSIIHSIFVFLALFSWLLGVHIRSYSIPEMRVDLDIEYFIWANLQKTVLAGFINHFMQRFTRNETSRRLQAEKECSRLNLART